MKYLIASLVILPVHLLFLLAFTAFALGVGASTLANKLVPQKISARLSRKGSQRDQ